MHITQTKISSMYKKLLKFKQNLMLRKTKLYTYNTENISKREKIKSEISIFN